MWQLGQTIALGSLFLGLSQTATPKLIFFSAVVWLGHEVVEYVNSVDRRAYYNKRAGMRAWHTSVITAAYGVFVVYLLSNALQGVFPIDVRIPAFVGAACLLAVLTVLGDVFRRHRQNRSDLNNKMNLTWRAITARGIEPVKVVSSLMLFSGNEIVDAYNLHLPKLI